MSKPKKVIRSHYMYKKQTHRVRNTLWFLLLVILLVGIGYILRKEWSKRFGPDAPASSAPPSSMAQAPEEPASSEPASSEPETPALSGMGVLLSPADAGQTGDELARLLKGYREQGYTYVLFDLKTEDGRVLFDSRSDMARSYRAVEPGAFSLDNLAAAVKQAGLVPVGRISALKDPLAAHVRNQNSFAYNDDPTINWIDNRADLGGKSWLNPYMEKARSYISGLCREAAERGVRVLLLSNVNFPTTPYQSNMGLLNETTTREQILLQLEEECQSAAGEVPVYNCYDAAWAGAGGENHTPAADGTLLAPALDLDAIAANKKALCQRYGLADSGGSESQISPADVAAALLRQGPGASPLGEEAVRALLPVVRRQDLDALRPVLDKLKITGYLIV